MPTPRITKLNPKKLLLSKWTTVAPQNKEKHFIVSQLLLPDDPASPVELIELEAIFSKRVFMLPWQALQDSSKWRQGWH